MTPTDQELATRAAKGDTVAFSMLYTRHHAPLVGYICANVPPARRDDAEDLAHDAWLRAFVALPALPDMRWFKTWLYTIAKHLVINLWRDRLKTVDIDLFYDLAAPDDTDERFLLSDDPLGGLLPRHREVLDLDIFGGYTYAEMGDILGLKVNAVRVLRHRAIRNLREQYQKDSL